VLFRSPTMYSLFARKGTPGPIQTVFEEDTVSAKTA
jgi:hypothetical protein